MDRRHFRRQLLVEFLVEVKRLRFADLLDDEEAGAPADLRRSARL